MRNVTFRRRVSAGFVAVGLSCSMFAFGTPADASVTHNVIPFSASGCTNNVCMYLSTPSGGTVYIQGWAWKHNFTGHFHLSGPGISSDSATTTWIAGGSNWNQWNGVSAVVGQYCIGGYATDGSYEGTACENIK
jgi:hypothetical protein